MRDPHSIILKPRVTEKAMRLAETQKYSFVVDRTATKPEIKNSVEKLFKVKVDHVRTMNVGGKRRRFLRGSSMLNNTDAKTMRRFLPY